MKKCFTFLILFIAIIIGIGFQFRLDLKAVRLYRVLNFFEPDVITENFRTMDQQGFPFRVISAHPELDQRFHLAPGPSSLSILPKTYRFLGKDRLLSDWIQNQNTTGLVVLKFNASSDQQQHIDAHTVPYGNQGSVQTIFESYFLGNDESSKCISWSVGKSFLSALFGIALDEGLIESVQDPVTKYLPSLVNTGYDNVKLYDVLTMSSGVGFNEDYFDLRSDINRMGHLLALGGSIDAFAASLEREFVPGTYNHYVSIDTHVLGMVLTQVLKPLGHNLSSYLEEKLWRPVGMEQDAFWMLDNDSDQMELSFGTLNLVTRDYARFGLVYLRDGISFKNEQVVPVEWVRQSTSVPKGHQHLMPGNQPELSNYILGYGLQWWLTPQQNFSERLLHSDDPSLLGDDFLAIGIYNQFIYVSPRHGIVIAKNSAFAKYNERQVESENESLQVFRTIADYIINNKD